MKLISILIAVMFFQSCGSHEDEVSNGPRSSHDRQSGDTLDSSPLPDQPEDAPQNWVDDENSTQGNNQTDGNSKGSGDLTNDDEDGDDSTDIKDPNDVGEGQNTQPEALPPRTSQTCYKADPFICEIELAILRQTNEYRAAASVRLLNSQMMGYAARMWSKQQADNGRIGHSGFPSQRYTYLEEEFGSSASVQFRAENVAYSGYGTNSTAEQIATMFTNMWWNSAGHRRNMLGNHTYLGVGIHVSRNGNYYATQLFGSE